MNPHLEAYASKNGKANGLPEAFNGNDAEEIENKFREVSHSKQGCSAEIPAGKM